MIGLISWWGRQKDWNCILIGRAYHISHNTTIHATREFWEVLGDKLGVNTDLYYHFHWFPKRKNILMEFNYFCDRKYSKITRLHSVRLFRLSSECLTRAIQLFSALRKSSFFSQDADIRDREIAACYLNSLINFFSSLHWHHWWIFVFFEKKTRSNNKRHVWFIIRDIIHAASSFQAVRIFETFQNRNTLKVWRGELRELFFKWQHIHRYC